MGGLSLGDVLLRQEGTPRARFVHLRHLVSREEKVVRSPRGGRDPWWSRPARASAAGTPPPRLHLTAEGTGPGCGGSGSAAAAGTAAPHGPASPSAVSAFPGAPTPWAPAGAGRDAGRAARTEGVWGLRRRSHGSRDGGGRCCPRSLRAWRPLGREGLASGPSGSPGGARQVPRAAALLTLCLCRGQLCYDYKFDFEDDQHKIPCHCGAVNCRKWMN